MIQAERALAELEPTIRAVVGGFRIPGYEREDLIQEARLHLIANLPAFDPVRGGTGRKWARTLVRHRLLDIRRAQARRLQPSLFGEIVEALEEAGRRRPRRLVEFKSACTSLQVETMMAVARGLSLAEIGRRRGVTKQAVHRILKRVRRKAVLLCVE